MFPISWILRISWNFYWNPEEFRDLGRFRVRRQARSLWISSKSYWNLLIFLNNLLSFLIFIDFERCRSRGLPGAGPVIPTDFHQKNTIDLKKEPLKWVKPPRTISKKWKTIFWHVRMNLAYQLLLGKFTSFKNWEDAPSQFAMNLCPKYSETSPPI